MGKKVLVVAYQISPTRGSEYSLAWNYINEMSKDNSLVVLYGISGNHLGDIEEISDWLKSHAIPNVDLIPVLPSKITSLLNVLNIKGIFPYSFYFAFCSWQRQVYRTAKQLVGSEHFDVIHNLNPIGYREPGYLWKLGLPYIWGPIGGMPNRPAQLFKMLGLTTRVKFVIRNMANSIQVCLGKRLKEAIRNTDLLLAATSENKAIVEKKFGRPAVYFPENGIRDPT